MDTRRMPTLTIPQRDTRNPAPLSQHQRLAVLQRVIAGEELPPGVRVAACLVLLFAQPVSRIVRLTIDDVRDGDGHVAIRLGDPASPVPEPLAGLLLEYIQTLSGTTTDANQDPKWLFPGRWPQRPMSPTTLRDYLREIAVPAERGRAAAIRQLVLQAPPPVIARALGYHDTTATRIAAEAGSPWSRYAPGDHNRRLR
jgi:hypothetical protein